jgi:hypothetical protein
MNIFYLLISLKLISKTSLNNKKKGSEYTTRQNSMFFFSFDLRFSLARQVPEIILSESSKNTENALIEWLPKETTRYFPKTKVYVVSLDLSLVFKTESF